MLCLRNSGGENLCKIEILTKSDEIPGSYLIDASGSIVISGGWPRSERGCPVVSLLSLSVSLAVSQFPSLSSVRHKAPLSPAPALVSDITSLTPECHSVTVSQCRHIQDNTINIYWCHVWTLKTLPRLL